MEGKRMASASLEMKCPARVCGFESRALRFFKLRLRLLARSAVAALTQSNLQCSRKLFLLEKIHKYFSLLFFATRREGGAFFTQDRFASCLEIYIREMTFGLPIVQLENAVQSILARIAR